MDQIEKALRKLTAKERKQLERLLALIEAGHFQGLDVRKLVGQEHVYRVRKGDLRIIFSVRKRSITVLALERRTTTTYRKR